MSPFTASIRSVLKGQPIGWLNIYVTNRVVIEHLRPGVRDDELVGCEWLDTELPLDVWAGVCRIRHLPDELGTHVLLPALRQRGEATAAVQELARRAAVRIERYAAMTDGVRVPELRDESTQADLDRLNAAGRIRRYRREVARHPEALRHLAFETALELVERAAWVALDVGTVLDQGSWLRDDERTTARADFLELFGA